MIANSHFKNVSKNKKRAVCLTQWPAWFWRVTRSHSQHFLDLQWDLIPSRWCADVAGSNRGGGVGEFPLPGWNSTRGDHNYYNSLRPIHEPLRLFTKPIVSTVAPLLMQQYCCCVKPTVTDGNPAIIYCNSLCATKWKQLSQSTQRSVEQITTHNSLWVWEIYFRRLTLSLRNSRSLQSHSLSLLFLFLCQLIIQTNVGVLL